MHSPVSFKGSLIFLQILGGFGMAVGYSKRLVEYSTIIMTQNFW
jgi:hypothetical protein